MFVANFLAIGPIKTAKGVANAQAILQAFIHLNKNPSFNPVFTLVITPDITNDILVPIISPVKICIRISFISLTCSVVYNKNNKYFKGYYI